MIRPHTWLAQAWQHAHHHPHGVYIGRFAPSPSGKLHQGSLIAALASYLHAHWHDGQWRVRMEDVDTTRCTAALGAHQLATLRGLGFEFDATVWWQTTRFAAYRAAFVHLRDSGRVYACGCSRKNMDACRCHNASVPDAMARAWRFRADSEPLSWQDESGQTIVQTVDDFVLRKGALNTDQYTDQWAYQFAVVVDDAAQGVTHVVRGADLVESTARQIALQHALDLPTPHYSHVPLLTTATGDKLSKSDQAPELDALHPIKALMHAWGFLGGVRFDCADVAAFWSAVVSPTPNHTNV